MIIEWHTHVYPPEEAAGSAFWGGRCPMTVENVLAAHHQAGLAVSVVGNAAHYLRGKLATREREAVFAGNAARLLELPVAATAVNGGAR